MAAQRDPLALPSPRVQALAVLLQLSFSQLGWMNRFFATAPLAAEEGLICAVCLLVMAPVAVLAERCDPTTGQAGP